MLKTIKVADFLQDNSLDESKPLFFDIETEELYYHASLIQIGNEEGEIYLVSIKNDKEQAQMIDYLADKWLVGYNISYDLGTLEFSPPNLDDLFYAAKIAFPQLQQFSLDNVASYYNCGFYEGLDKSQLQKKGFIRGSYLSQQQLRYAQTDVEVLRRMWRDPNIQDILQNNLAYRLGRYALKEAMIWQQNGLPVLEETLEKYLHLAREKEKDYMQQMYNLIGREINPRSSKQVKEYFGTVSSDKATLTRIAIEGKLDAAKEYADKVRVKARDAQDFNETEQKMAEIILNARKAKNDISKLSGYVGNKKMYGRFNPMGTSTSRWSCKGTQKGSSRPELFNAQNYSRDFKAVFGVKPGSGQIIVAADYATLEIRIAACMMKEPNMYQALMDGVDIHKSTASLLFNKPIAEVHGKERSNAKVSNFGLTYGMGRETFKHYAYDMYGIKFTDEEAGDLIAKFFKGYPGLKAYHNMVGKKLRRHNYICQTALGYRMKPKMYAEAINGPTQGTGGECMRLAIHLLIKKDERAYQYIINSIHDALYLLVPEEEKEYWGALLKEAMQEAWYEIRKSKEFHWHDVPMPVDVMYGYNMGELEEDFAGGGQALTLDEMREQKERNKT